MTINYCELVELKARLIGENATLTNLDDLMMEQAIEGVSRSIENYCGRRFYVTEETRTYTAVHDDLLFIDDLTAVTTLKTDEDGDRTYEVTWATTDYDLLPDNAALDGAPYTMIAITPDGDYNFPVGIRKGVQLKAFFGYSTTVPAQVREACLLQCARIYKRKDAPFGVVGNAELGELRVLQKLDPDVEFMLRPLARVV